LGKENATMRLITLTFAALLLAGLSGCIVVPAGPGYYSGGHGYYHDYDGRRWYR
jgi:hypothetical protein